MTVKERMYHHLYKIKNFKPYRKNINEVSIHFNTGQHYLNNFNFCIFKTGLSDNIERKSADNDLINFLNIYKKDAFMFFFQIILKNLSLNELNIR